MARSLGYNYSPKDFCEILNTVRLCPSIPLSSYVISWVRNERGVIEMNTKLFRAVALALLGVVTICSGPSAFAQRSYDHGRRESSEDRLQRDIRRTERRIDELKSDRERARSHHNFPEVRRIENALDRERDNLRHYRERARRRDHGY